MDQTAGILSGFIDFFTAWDRLYFVKINGLWTNSIFDKAMPIITDLHKQPIGIAVMALLCVFWMYKNPKRGWRFVLTLAIAIGASDMIAYRAVKPVFERPRPEFTKGLPVTLRVPSTASFSFPSNHAANMFAAATILWFALPGYGVTFLILAALIAYSRVYVGVHFPIDVVGGAFLGFVIGRIVWNLLGHWCEYEAPPEPSGRLKSYARTAKNPTGE